MPICRWVSEQAAKCNAGALLGLHLHLCTLTVRLKCLRPVFVSAAAVPQPIHCVHGRCVAPVGRISASRGAAGRRQQQRSSSADNNLIVGGLSGPQ